MENKFLAHIAEDGREQTVFEHLAEEFSRPFGGEAQGLLAGTAHDIGKYSAAFQHAANPFPSTLTVGGVHQSGRMEGAFFFQQPEQLPRGFPDMKSSVSRKSAATRQE